MFIGFLVGHLVRTSMSVNGHAEPLCGTFGSYLYSPLDLHTFLMGNLMNFSPRKNRVCSRRAYDTNNNTPELCGPIYEISSQQPSETITTRDEDEATQRKWQDMKDNLNKEIKEISFA